MLNFFFKNPTVKTDLFKQKMPQQKLLTEQEFIEEVEEISGEVEVLRKKFLKSLIIRFFVSLIVIYGTWQMVPLTGSYHIGWFALLGPGYVLLLSLCYAITTQPIWNYKRKYKETYFPLIGRLFGSFEYSFEPPLNPIKSFLGLFQSSTLYDYKSSGIIPKHDYADVEDRFDGIYKSIPLSISDLSLKKKVRKRKKGKTKTEYKEIFKGIFVKAKLAEFKISSHIIIDADKSKSKERGFEKKTGLKKANMVSPEFEALIDVYTNDQVEARYLIDPIMIERLTKLYELCDAKDMKVAIYDANVSSPGINHGEQDMNLLILINTQKNYFESPTIFRSSINISHLKQIREQFYSTFEVLDTLQIADKSRKQGTK